MTVGELKKILENAADTLPIAVVDCRSGVIEPLEGCEFKWFMPHEYCEPGPMEGTAEQGDAICEFYIG